MEAAKEKLVTENMSLAGFMIKRYSNIGIEWEDLQSLCYLGLVEAANRFDENRGMAFSTFACTCMRNKILRIVRDRKALKRDFTTVSLDTVVFNGGDKPPLTMEDILPSEETAYGQIEESSLIRSIRCSGDLTETEREVLMLWLAGERQDAIGKRVGRSQSYVSRLVKGGAKKLYAGNYL